MTKVLLLAAACVLPCVEAASFLQSRNLQELTREMVRRTLAAELGMESEHTHRLEADMRSMYAALPKNEHGRLDPVTTRYALHRHFVSKNGWYIKGLEPRGQAWNSTSLGSLTNRIPTFIEGLFDEHLHGQGLGLHELAAFAATLGDFVHNAALADVVDLFRALDYETDANLLPHQADKVVRAYILQTLDGNGTINESSDIAWFEQEMLETFPDWEDFKSWVGDVRQTRALEHSRGHLQKQELSLENVVGDVAALNEQLGAFQDINCRSLKAALADVEWQSTGRVLLSDFYKIGMEGKFLFIEYVEYLRRLGALDESDPAHPKVIIANYLAGPANCMIATNFHSVCCFDECENLLGQLESSIAAPTALPGRIAELVSKMPSDTVDSPRNLSSTMTLRLKEIADHHEGVVPLHGRLFAQWLHHAYPMECPFPHVSGTTSPLAPDEWLDATDIDEISAPEAERKKQIEAARPAVNATRAVAWDNVEELVVPVRRPRGQRSVFTVRRGLAFLAVVAFAASMLQMLSKTVSRQCKGKADKFLV